MRISKYILVLTKMMRMHLLFLKANNQSKIEWCGFVLIGSKCSVAKDNAACL